MISRQPKGVAIAIGVSAGAVALGFGELFAGIAGTPKSPLAVVGGRVVDGAPKVVRDVAIDWFGTRDKAVLLAGIVAVGLVLAAGVGLLARRRLELGLAALAGFGAIGVAAALVEPSAGAAAVAAPALAGVVGIASLWFLTAVLLPLPHEVPEPESDPSIGGAATGEVSRRRFLALTGGAAALAVSAGAVGRLLQSQGRAAASRLAVLLPIPRRRPAPVPPGAELGLNGLSPVITPNRSFYRIDTSLFVPQVTTEGWSLRIHGMVDREIRLSYDDLLARDLVEVDITLACVSNEVGGGLVGNARWLGAPLSQLLDEAGVQRGADQIVGRSVDNFTAGFPVGAVDDERPAIVAVGMNGEPLPLRHGFPARLVVAGLYGYVSATKWLAEIELTRFDRFDAYWIRRGWAEQAPVKTMARIDTPRSSRGLVAGSLPVAGVAWAPTRGIAGVDVQVDDGPWEAAQLAEAISDETWRQWVFEWQATPGKHRLRARATDGEGTTQTEERAEPFPDGATGWHSVIVDVG
ncbi:MAG: molybdopterin-dependent oxidoreductase [Acidimicrobiales bacterium]